MTDNLKRFLIAVAKDTEWVQWVNALAGKEDAIAAAIAKAAELDIPLTAADFEAPEGELSEDELASVSGGGCSCSLSGNGMFVIGDEDDRVAPTPIPHLCITIGCAIDDPTDLEAPGSPLPTNAFMPIR